MKTKTMVLKPPTRKIFWLDRESAPEIADLCEGDGLSVKIDLRDDCLDFFRWGTFSDRIWFETWVYFREGSLGGGLGEFNNYDNEWEECE